VAHAVDPQAIVDRVYDGVGEPNSAPFANLPWDPKSEGRAYDPDEARRLLDEAKAEGFDGTIRVLATNTPEQTAWGQTVQALLQGAGFDVVLDTTKDTPAIVSQVFVEKDYDIVYWGLGISDESDQNYLALSQTFAGKRYGYGPQDMIDAVDMLRTATNDQERTAAYEAISEIWVRDVPALTTTSAQQMLVHAPELHGVERTAVSSFLFGNAWLEQ
jgi:peptide/nickel transport system substrate-binding protein